jgi:NosR/NirI family transcriptional regulator, nitrous oxide reductase regulator
MGMINTPFGGLSLSKCRPLAKDYDKLCINGFLRKCFLLFLFCCNLAQAGTLKKQDLEKVFAAPLAVGEINAALPVWPVFQAASNDTAAPKPKLLGYVFESADFAPVRGYGGKPVNLLVAIDPMGKFLAVQLISHKEPLFDHPQGNAVLDTFARQFKDLTLSHRIEIFGAKAAVKRDASSATLHGVSAGTVTVKAMERSIIESAMTVARAHAQTMAHNKKKDASAEPDGILTVGASTTDKFTPMTWAQLVDEDLVTSLTLSRKDIERGFKGTKVEGADKLAASEPRETAIEMHVALVSSAQIGRNALDDAGWQLLQSNMGGASAALMVIELGPLAKMQYESQRVPIDVPYVIKQGGKELQLRAMSYDKAVTQPDAAKKPKSTHIDVPDDKLPTLHRVVMLLVDANTPLDVNQPFELALRITRKASNFPYPTFDANYPIDYPVGKALKSVANSGDRAWIGSWRARAWEIAVLCLGLAILAVALAKQLWLSQSPRRLQRFRVGYLLFTLIFIGWFAQGQLTIVNITSSLDAALTGGNLSFLLSDPMTVILWCFVFITLFVWGRGTFCGWLCPFGALQELVSMVTQHPLIATLGFKQIRLKTRVDAKLKYLKYGVLAVIVLTVFVAPDWTSTSVEIEPFKTAISSYFDRDWPYVLWAVACVLLGSFVYRGYCRYICPLGAALAATDFARRWNWIPRRSECGTPCQSCRHRCEYQAIEPVGKVDYSECFQCLDCVSIYQDDTRCLPLINERKIIAIQPVRTV